MLKRTLVLLLAVVTIAAMTACGPAAQTKDSAGKTQANGENAAITVWTFLDPKATDGRSKVLKEVMDMYETAYPNVKVNVEPQQWDTMTAKFFAASQTKEAPDVIFVNGSDLGEAIKLGSLEPLENLFLKDWTQEQINDIDGPTFQYGATDKAHYQIHLFANEHGLLYNANYFKEKGIDPNFKSWDDLLKAAQALTFTDPKTGMKVWGIGTGYSEDGADFCYLLTAILSEYGDFIDENGHANWATDVGAKALQFQIDLIDKYNVMPTSSISSTSDEVYSDFCAGKYAMIFGGSTRVDKVRSQATFDPNDVGLMPFPDINGKTGKGIGSGWNVGVWSGSKHKEEAGKFVEMLCSPEADKLWVTEGGQVPLLKSTLNTLGDDYFDLPEHKFLKVAADIKDNHALLYNANYATSGVNADFVRAMQYAYAEGRSVEDALKTTANEFNERTGN